MKKINISGSSSAPKAACDKVTKSLKAAEPFWWLSERIRIQTTAAQSSGGDEAPGSAWIGINRASALK